jgi:hypothetical protein
VAVVPFEVRTYRNWQLAVFSALGWVTFAVGGAIGPTHVGYLVVPFAGLFVAALRQHVIVTATDVELHGVFRHRTVALSEVRALSVRFTFMRRWRIRLHCGGYVADTFGFVNMVGFRQFGASFAQPPPDAPAPVKELFAVLAARIVALGEPTRSQPS